MAKEVQLTARCSVEIVSHENYCNELAKYRAMSGSDPRRQSLLDALHQWENWALLQLT